MLLESLRWPSVLLCLLACPPEDPSWSVSRRGTLLEIAHGSARGYSQYAALHLESGYLRLIPGPGSGWGTSVILVPSFWEGGILHQGAPLQAVWRTRSRDLVIDLQGSVARLAVALTLRLEPPAGDSLTAGVTATTNGDVQLEPRPGEAFKPVMLSSMYVAPDRWDAQSAHVDGVNLPFPTSGWIANPPIQATRFGLRGGTSAWKTNAPAIELTLDEPRLITGWVTPSRDPNDDNVGLWAAADRVLRAWRYTIVARR